MNFSFYNDFNPFATGDAYRCQLFHCLQWYADHVAKGLIQFENIGFIFKMDFRGF